MKIKIFILGFCIMMVGSLLQAQHYRINLSSDSVSKEIENRLINSGKEELASEFMLMWESVDNDFQNKIKEHIELLGKKKYPFSPALTGFIRMISLGVNKEGLDNQKLEELLFVNKNVIQNHPQNQYYSFLKSTITFFNNRAMHSEGGHRWMVHNDVYSFEYKKPFIAEVTPQEEISDTEDYWADNQETDDDYWGDDEASEDDSWDDWDEEDDSWDDDDWDTADDSWEEEDDSWENEESTEEEDWDSWDNSIKEEDETTYGEEVTEDLLQAYGLIKPVAGVEGAAIVFETLDINLITAHDSVFIKSTSGSLDLINGRFVGEAGTFDWSPAGLNDVVATLDAYELKPSLSYFEATKVSLSYPEKLEEPILGVLKFKSVPRDTAIENSFPRFTSYGNNIPLKGFSEDVIYHGGFNLRGQKINSRSIMGGLSRLILKNEGNKKAKSYSRLYTFRDSAIYSDMSSLVIYHGYDSIYHPAVRMRYDYKNNKLVVQKAKNGFRNTPFNSTYFKLNFTADMIKWDLASDSMDISILQGEKMVPVVFESNNHYNEDDYRYLGKRLYDFHPLAVVNNYAEKFQTDRFFTSNLANYYKKDQEVFHKAMIMLMEKALIDYNVSSREINLKPRGKHLFRSKFGESDYDNIIIPSVIDSLPNATINFDEGYVRIRGVEEFLVSDSLYVKVQPDSSEILMYENRNFSFNGRVTAGNFEYIGRDFTFSYDSFLINLKKIDSVRFFVQKENAKGESSRERINNALVGLDSTTAKNAGLVGFANKTSGTLYINSPGNKSGRADVPNYPKFAAGEGAVVYFDRKNVLDGLYKKELYFVIPPFDIDSLNDSDPSAIGFDGVFVSNGILPNIEERLHYVGDNSMGFEHEIPPNGYNLYETEGKLFGDIELNSKGLRGKGRIEFLASNLQSDDIIMYPDSLVATGSDAGILEEQFGDLTFPQANLNEFRVKWIPKQDEMTFTSTTKPFTFYNEIATFEGDVMVKSDGVFGSGDIELKGATASSEEMKMEQSRLLARNASFNVKTNNPDKPALSGDDVRVLFDLENNYAEISPEVEGTAALDFPYAQFKTSITKATWDLENQKITMSKPDNVPLESSYFYTTREDLDSLAFNATEAVYDMNTQEMTVRGIPNIKVADAFITPENNEVLILENSRIGQLTNTTIILDTLYGYHMLTDGVIDIKSRNEFSGYATYQFVNASQDTFAIKMENFRLERIKDEDDRKNDEGSLHTVANGSVVADDDIVISPGILYKGDMILYAHQPAMELDGYVKLNFTTVPGYDTWIKYSSSAEQQEVMIDFDEAITEEGKKLDAGLLFSAYDNNMYGIFVNEKLGLDDEYFFKPSGILRYKPGNNTYVIADTAKVSGSRYEGKVYTYNENTGDVTFEGKVRFMENTKDIDVQASVLGEGNVDEERFEINSFLTFDFNIPSSAYEMMAADLIDVVTNLGAPEGRGDQTQLLYKLSNIMGERATREFERASYEEYIPLGNFDKYVSKGLVFSDVNLKWSPEYDAFYSDGLLGLSNIYRNELNAGFEGFMEMKKSEDGSPVINIFVKASAASWYYFGLEGNQLLVYSSNDEFNQYITKRSNAGKAKIDELTFLPGTEAEVLDFINRFRFEYYDISDPYVLDAAADMETDEEEPAEEEEEEDDGFEDDGF